MLLPDFIDKVCVKLLKMPKTEPQTGNRREFPILSWLGIIICFVIFPAGLINLGLEQLFATISANNREEIAGSMEKALKTVELFSNNEYFAHHLLLEINQRVSAAANPQADFARLKKNLQKRYPDAFTFIFWNENGNQVKELSDETSFGYIIKKTYQFLKKASDILGHWEETSEKINLGTLADIEKEANILRNFLGKLLVSYQLRYPWLSGHLGRPLQTAPPGPRSRIWFRINEKFGFLCFISDSFIRSNAGMRFAVAQTARDLPDFKVHITDYPASENFFPQADSGVAPRLVQALSRFEAISPARFEEMDNVLVGCQIIDQSQRAVCYCSADRLFSGEQAKYEYIGHGARLIIPSLFVLLVWIKTRSSGFVSVRFKLIAIFLYAGGIPLIIMGSVGIEYLEQKKQQLIYEAQTRGINVLYNIDRHFQIFLHDQAQILAKNIKSFNDTYGLKTIEAEKLSGLRGRLLTETGAESIQVYNEKGHALVQDSSKTIFSDYTISSQIAVEVLQSVKPAGASANNANPILSNNFGLDASAKKREIETLALGAHELYFFFDFLGKPDAYENLAMLELFWRREKLQQNFFETFHRTSLVRDIPDQASVIAYYPGEDLIYPAIPAGENLKTFCQNSYSNEIGRKNLLVLGTNNYSSVAIRGMNLDRICLLFLLPLNGIEKAVVQLRLHMFAIASVFLLLAFMMFRFLAGRFLVPISEIRHAIKAINDRDFSGRLQIDSSSEFRELSQTFNATLETLHDLETARIVQENLLPEREAVVGDLQMVAYSQAYSRIGGDYFDFFKIGERTLGIFIGDVSGHGISAALIMAMAKATVISVKNDFVDEIHLIEAIDQMIHANRKSGTREYMTGIFISIADENGLCRLINRGHCMPILVGNEGVSAEHIKSGGLPLGYARADCNRIIEFSLQPGETLCLFTDGVSEACCKKGTPLGYDGFKEMLRTTWHENIDEYLKILMQSHRNWADFQDDDQSVVLVRRNG